MDFSNIPKKIDKNVLTFCKTINPKSNPEFIPLKPESWCKMNECYDNVAHKIKNCGGKRQLGWRIQIIPDPLPKYMMEAIHHAIWISETKKKSILHPYQFLRIKSSFYQMNLLYLTNIGLVKNTMH